MVFKKGQSGNPGGRPKGIKDRRTVFREHLESHSKDLIKKAVELALAGDVRAMKLCLERIAPAVKPRDEPVEIGMLRGSLTKQGQRIIKAMGLGELSPSEAASMLSALASQTRLVEADELEKRITALEAKS